MEEPHFIKCESELLGGEEETTNLVPNPLLPTADDMLAEIKFEPCHVFADENSYEAGVSTVKEEYEIQESFELVSDMKPVNEETKLELTEPGPNQGKIFEPSACIMEEISIEQDTFGELLPRVKKGNKPDNDAVPVHIGEEADASKLQHDTFPYRFPSEQHSSRERRFFCSECNSSFYMKSHIRAHMRVHTGERPYECSKCRSSFSKKTSLDRHMLVHSGVRAYKCDECNSSFTRKSHLHRHKLYHAGVRPFICDKCNASFTEKSALLDHVKIHSGVKIKPYQCNQCRKSFARSSDLRKHEIIHSEARPYSCNECNRSFSRKIGVRSHIAIHSVKRP
ncbi:gastrula zinc finger protein XlCGF7.1 [Anabrus simplex]|uniref:gastrula zinc finger protein XlCGF7.1 n=1 Tax=Anabrus simplex TaxID=316456 RepID=UPI0035A3261C